MSASYLCAIPDSTECMLVVCKKIYAKKLWVNSSTLIGQIVHKPSCQSRTNFFIIASGHILGLLSFFFWSYPAGYCELKAEIVSHFKNTELTSAAAVVGWHLDIQTLINPPFRSIYFSLVFIYLLLSLHTQTRLLNVCVSGLFFSPLCTMFDLVNLALNSILLLYTKYLIHILQ